MKRRNETATFAAGSQIVLGLLLVAAPWAIGFTNWETAAWSAWLTGAAMALVGIAAAWRYAQAAWGNLALGAWAVLAPWILGFLAMAGAMWMHIIVGVLVAAAAAFHLWWMTGTPTQVHA
ncbi:hypothetical protein GCM10011504_53170 [Siccirubricoccus deserti]|uniref:SPW repeat protein n=1 Tax=Siccirubricoccus deserti TaxID=2013562 RepID=A0A9X0R5B6_9PROT|nr:SPW repeat protein [Siccirubricoccus deserti]MBC4018828.1 SPW repeat protein [Siccirubricoccus deserti]GGC68603.1 hypothetical protein GCM10011504_53170 [Siccirubricoccus deserti]